MTTTTVRTVYLDSGLRAKVQDDPFWITYECSGCKTFCDTTTPHSEWSFADERWVSRRYCDECLERAL